MSYASYLYESLHSNSIQVRQINYKTDISNIINIIDNLSERDKEFTALIFEKKRNHVIEYIKKNQGYVAIKDGIIIGFSVYETYKDSEYTLLDEFIIDKNYRKIGASKKLLNKFHSIFKKTIALTHKDNDVMINILKKNGYDKLFENVYQGTIMWIRIK